MVEVGFEPRHSILMLKKTLTPAGVRVGEVRSLLLWVKTLPVSYH